VLGIERIKSSDRATASEKNITHQQHDTLLYEANIFSYIAAGVRADHRVGLYTRSI
jgi:hypothetical protein